VEQALDLLLYGPLGLALTVRDEFPKLVEKGRQQIAGQMLVARMAGEFALGQAQREMERLVGQASERLHELQQQRGPLPTQPPRAPAPADARGPEPVPATEDANGAPRPAPPPPPAAGASAPPEPHRASSNGPGAGGVDGAVADGARPPALAIPGYDLLSASQVVQRLAGLSPEELEEVRAHEASHRGRKTILTRIHQLQADT
jgi:hypothetical protein